MRFRQPIYADDYFARYAADACRRCHAAMPRDADFSQLAMLMMRCRHVHAAIIISLRHDIRRYGDMIMRITAAIIADMAKILS